MPSIAAIRRRHSARMRRAVHNNLRNRRDSHRGFPDLHGTHLIPLCGSLSAVTNFPNRRRDITFKFRVDRVDDDASGAIVTLGDQGYIGFVDGEIAVLTGGPPGTLITAPFIGAPRSEAEVVVALRPQLGEVRIWVDSEAPTVAAQVETWPYDWATSGLVRYSDSNGICPPRSGPAPVFIEDVLCRAARWANFATERVIFMDNGIVNPPGLALALKPYLSIYDGSVPFHCDKAVDPFTPVVPVEDLLCRAARWANTATSRVIFMERP
jgi:hypothetical protein